MILASVLNLWPYNISISYDYSKETSVSFSLLLTLPPPTKPLTRTHVRIIIKVSHNKIEQVV